MGWFKKILGGDEKPTAKREAADDPSAPAGDAAGGDDEIDIDDLSMQTKSRWERVTQPGTQVQVIMETVAQEEMKNYKTLLEFGGKFHPVTNRSLLGRHSRCNIIVRGDPEVSREHATVRVSARSGLEVMDHGSVNGTYVNGNPIAKKEWVRLHTGARLNLGSRVAFQVFIEGPAGEKY